MPFLPPPVAPFSAPCHPPPIAAATTVTYRARGVEIRTPETDIQIFPPGRHQVTCTGPDGKPVEITANVDESGAQALEAIRAKYQAAADAGSGDAPYFDFNHEDGAAAAWPKEIYWGGDDPQTGGIRAKVEWSDQGQAAIQGKSFRRFSPAFHIDDTTGRITGAPVNMGGLVNRAAFTRISALFSRAAENAAASPGQEAAAQQPDPATTPATTTTMTEDEIQALKDQIASLQAQVEELTKERDALAAKNGEHEEHQAKAAIDLAAKEGRIAPAQESRDHWLRAYRNDPDGTQALLAGLPPNPALRQITGPAPADPAHTAKGSEADATKAKATGVTRLKLALKPTPAA